MNLGVKIKTFTSNQKKIISIKYIKRPCNFYGKHLCDMLHVTNEIDRSENKLAPHRHDIHKYYLYIPENPNGESKLVIERHSPDYIEIDSAFQFLSNVFTFLYFARKKGEIKGLEPLLFVVSDLLGMEADRGCRR